MHLRSTYENKALHLENVKKETWQYFEDNADC